VKYLHALRDARLRLPDVLNLIAEADTDEAALTGIQRLLGCDATAAAGVYAMQLRRLRTHPRDLLTDEITELERDLGDSASG
jgi:DNA gyrase/topoisomerase IV subunit A